MGMTEEQNIYDWIEDRFPYDGPHSADTVREAALVVSRLVRYLNNATQHSNARYTLEWANTANDVIGYIRASAHGQAQLLEQLAERLAYQAAEDPTLYDDRRSVKWPAPVTARHAASKLMAAAEQTMQLSSAIGAAQLHTTHLGNS